MTLQPAIFAFARLLVRIFFRRVEVTGLEHVPAEGGALIVSWHPNGLIDPALIAAFCPRPVIFGARHGLFRWPGLGWLLRGAGTVSIHRRQDTVNLSPEARRNINARSLDALAQAVARGGLSCLFPEGDSHDAPHLLALKTGAARFYYRARQLQVPGQKPPVILPVGLHYDAKRRFRSSVLLSFHSPLSLPAELDLTPEENEDGAPSRERARRLTDRIEAVLHDVVHATESWELHHQMHRARKLVRAERARRAGVRLEKPGMVERQVAFARVWAGYNIMRERLPAQVQALGEKIAEYDADLRALGMEDHELDAPPQQSRVRRAFLLGLQLVGVYFFLPALILLGAVVNWIPYLLLRIVARVASRKKKDEATIKLLVGALLYPLTWSVAAFLGAHAATRLHAIYPMVPQTPWAAAVVVALFGVIGGMVTLRYTRLVRETARAIRVRLTRARALVSVARLRVERSELTDALIVMSEGLDLPGTVSDQGVVLAQNKSDA